MTSVLFFFLLLFQFKLPLFLYFPFFPAHSLTFSFQLLLLRHITGGEGLELLRGDAAQYAVLIQSLEDGLQFRLALFHP